jgi:hypothetical protein
MPRYGVIKSDRLVVAAAGAPRMKLQAQVTSAFPAALAVASIFMAVLLLPGGAASPRSAGVAPALKLVAGDVVAAVEAPVHAVTKTHRHSRAAVSHSRASAGTPTTTLHHAVTRRTRAVPAYPPVHHRHPAGARPTPRVPEATRPAARPAPKSAFPAVTRGHGKAKVLGHARKASALLRTHGRPAGVPPGPAVVPPGQVSGDHGVRAHGAPSVRGGRK